MSEWLKSDVFIIFVVLLLLAVIVLIALCFIIRRHRIYSKTEKPARIEISVPDRPDQPKFLMKIVTEQKNASEMVQIAIHRIYSAKADGAFVTAAVASASQDQPQIDPLPSSHTETDDTSPSEEPSTLLAVPATNPSELVVTAVVHTETVPPDEKKAVVIEKQSSPILTQYKRKEKKKNLEVKFIELK